MNPRGKVALVTGAGGRIGRAIAEALARAGAVVAVHYATSQDGAAHTATVIEQAGGKAAVFQADLADPAEPGALADRVLERLGSLDIIVNNASAFGRLPLMDTSVKEWDHHFAVHVRAPFLLAQALKRSLPAGGAGKIINLNDWRTARSDRFAYGVSKAALSGLTRSLAVALAPDIQVCELALGAILPPADIRPGERPEKADLGPARRTGTVEEVAQAALALIANDFITGETLYVDGGRHVV